jgi:hypothetical protein
MVRVAILLPTKGRANQLLERMTALLNQEPPTDVHLMVIFAPVANDHYTLSAVEVLLERSWHDRISTYQIIRTNADSTTVQGFNTAYQYAQQLEPDWYVLGADDLLWGDGWLKEALTVADKHGAQVVGLNDGHTDIGDYSSHYMISAGFCAEFIGGIAPDEYTCWWFDREVCELAERLSLYHPAYRANVEHTHPNWNTALMDDTYRQMWPSHDQDKALYLERKQNYEISSA